MKTRQLFVMFGVAAMLASCSQDELGGARTGGAVTITATVDNGIGTRASTYDKDDVTIDRCLLEVYDTDSNIVGEQLTGSPGTQDGTFTFTVNGLDPDMEYDFLFWADCGEAEAYGGNLKERKLADDADLGEALAFQGKIDGAKPADATAVTLAHAVAKVTLRTTGAMAAGDKVTLSIPGIADTWNVSAGTAAGTGNCEYAYTLASAIAQPQDAAEVTTFYVPAPVLGQTSDITLSYADAASTKSGSTNVTNVPLQANYRTVLKGDVAALFGGAAATITAQLTEVWNDQSGESVFPQTNVIETTGVGQITADEVKKAAEIGNGTVVVNGQINKADLDVIAKMTGIGINLDLSQAKLMTDDGTQAVTEFPASFQYNTFTGDESALTGIILPSGIVSLADNCFKYCETLKTITFPEGFKKIGQSAFDNCSSLTLPDLEGVEEIGQYAFRNSAISGGLVVPSSLTSAGRGCFSTTKLASVTWESDCKVPENAFCYCANLTSITLATGAELGYYIANDPSSGVTQTPAFVLTCKSTTPPTISTQTFQYSTISTIYVPEEAIDDYKKGNYLWAKYADVIKPIQ